MGDPMGGRRGAGRGMFALLAVHAPPTKQVESWGVPGRLDMSGFHTSCPVGLGQLNNQEAVAQGCPAWFRAATGPTVPYKASLGARVAAEATRMGSYVHH